MKVRTKGYEDKKLKDRNLLLTEIFSTISLYLAVMGAPNREVNSKVVTAPKTQSRR